MFNRAETLFAAVLLLAAAPPSVAETGADTAARLSREAGEYAQRIHREHMEQAERMRRDAQETFERNGQRMIEEGNRIQRLQLQECREARANRKRKKWYCFE